MRKFIYILVFIVACSPKPKVQEIEEVSLKTSSQQSKWPEKLSEWELFKEPYVSLQPTTQVFSYEINSALFSDYAFKARFIKLPKDSVMKYEHTKTLDFPVGTVLIKNFYYPDNFQKPEGERRVLETRLLVNEKDGWKAVPYIWNEDQTDAYLEVAGSTLQVSWIDAHGASVDLDYSVPNQVQCKSCHERNGKFSPIGPTARQLNKNDQLEKWSKEGRLTGLPEDGIPQLVDYNDVGQTIASRARAWLEINCAHCHNSEGPAKNTGLLLWASESDSYKLGINKPPVAAGRGSGGLKYGIVPGKPDESIMYYRIKSVDPGVMMPELGRKMEHEEGVALIRQWIAEMSEGQI